MAQLLALEWDTNQARFALAALRGNDAYIEQAFSISLAGRTPEETLDQTGISERITAGLAARGINRADCLVAVGRSSIELRLLSLPPAPEEEFPEMVRFQAAQEFAGLGEDWPLDFFPVESANEQGQNVLAAAISPELVKQVKETCQAADLRANRLVLRPCAAASLLRRQTQTDRRVRLTVELLTDEADLTVLKDQTVVFMRTARLPGEEGSSSRTRALVGELRRTIAAAQNQLGGEKIEVIILYGTNNDHAGIQSQITQDLSLDVEIFNPFSNLQLGRELKNNLPDQPGSFAPLLGMLLDEAAESPPSIDFLHPRKKPPPASNRRTYSLIGSAVAAVVFIAAVGVGWYFWSLKAEVRTLTEKSNKLEDTVEAAEIRRANLKEIENWLSGDVPWLDELRNVSAKLPPADKVKVTNLELQALPNKPTIQIHGVAHEVSLIAEMERALRDEHFGVRGHHSREIQGDPLYPWSFEETITINSISEDKTKSSSKDKPTDDTIESAGDVTEGDVTEKEEKEEEADENEKELDKNDESVDKESKDEEPAEEEPLDESPTEEGPSIVKDAPKDEELNKGESLPLANTSPEKGEE